MEVPEPRPSATVILAAPAETPAGDADYRVFLLKRTRSSGFMAGAHVFPGGVCDPSDRADAWQELLGRPEPLDELTALRLTAIRETFEEAGVLLAEPAFEDSDGWRRRVHADASQFPILCRQAGLQPALERLGYWQRWITPRQEKRRYDAVFYLVVLDRLPAAEHDRTETVASQWFSPGEALDSAANGAIFLPPPTWCVFRELTSFPTLSALAAEASTRSLPDPIQPEMVLRDGQMVLLLPGDAEHPLRPGAAGELHRIVMAGGYRLVRSK